MSTANRTVRAIFLAGSNIDAGEDQTQMRDQAQIIRTRPGISLLTDSGSLPPPLPVRAATLCRFMISRFRTLPPPIRLSESSTLPKILDLHEELLCGPLNPEGKRVFNESVIGAGIENRERIQFIAY